MMQTSDRILDRLQPSIRPQRSLAGYQTWTDLLFVHWRIPVEMLVPLLPRELTVDTWEGEAWVGLVPFRMSGVRPWWSPALPGISNFPEANVRTYVHRDGRDPGVWFFSLEAAQWLAVRLARWGWHLPYYWASMQVERLESRVEYRSRRLSREGRSATVRTVAEIGPVLPSNKDGQAVPGTFEHFLVERYLLYSQSRRGVLYRGQVHHTPYPLRQAKLLEFQESLLAAAGIFPPDPPCHVLFSPGVQVEVFPLERLSPVSNRA
jgi:hypothetical protein